MRSEGLGGSQDGPEVPGILNLIERQQEGRLAALAGDLEEGVQLEVLARRHARHDALMTVGTGDRRELLARAVGDLDADAARQRDHFRERPAPAREHRDLIDAPSAATEQLEDRVPPPDAVLAHTLFRVMRGPLGVSSTLQPRRWISSRSWSARLQSRRARACPRSSTSLSTSAGVPPTSAARWRSPRTCPSVTSSETPPAKCSRARSSADVRSRASDSTRARSKSTPRACGVLKSSSMEIGR